MKCSIKNLFNVKLTTKKPPNNHLTKDGIGDSKLQITVAPEKLMWPYGKTYPKKHVAIVTKCIVNPVMW